MLKNYFIELGNVFKNSWIFFIENFKKTSFLWILILLQIIIGIPLIYLSKEYPINTITLPIGIVSVVVLLIYLTTFFFMYKKVYDLTSIALDKDTISNKKIITSLLAIGLLNLFPFVAFLICICLAQAFPSLMFILKVCLNIFTILFYFAMCLSIASIVNWQDKNVFVAIFNGIKTFFKKLALVIPVFFVLLIIASLIVFVICTIIYAIGIYFNLLDENMIGAIHAVINIYSLYMIAGFYIACQAYILKDKQ